MTANASVSSLTEDSVAVDLLSSTNPARVAYTWKDGTPRVIPIWFHWDGSAIVICTLPRAPKLKVLQHRPAVAVTIDSNAMPYHAVSIRGSAEVEVFDDVCDEYVAAARRYLGAEQGSAWAETLRGKPMWRIRIAPQWVNIIDFETRLPSALMS